MDVALPRLALSLAMLAGAAVLDVRSRRVANLYWVPFGLMAGVFAVADLLSPAATPVSLAFAYTAAAALSGLFYLLWWLRLFGGADAKGLMVLAFLDPWPVPGGVPVPPVMGVLVCGYLLTLLYPLGLLAWNMAHGRFALPAAFLGLPMDLDRARRAKVWPIQEADAEGKVHWRYWTRLGVDMEERYRGLDRAGLRTVWTTPKLPLMLPLAFGAVAWAWLARIPWPGLR